MDNNQTGAALAAISKSAVIVRVKIRRWSGVKLDHSIGQDVQSRAGATEKCVNANKELLPGCAALKDLGKLGSEIRDFLRDETVPWFVERLLPNSRYVDFVGKADALTRRHDAMADGFTREYEDARLEAQKIMGKLFNPADYPPPEVVRARFSVEFIYAPVPTSSNFALDVFDRSHASLVEATRRQEREATHAAIAEVWGRVAAVTSRMADSLAGYQPKKETGADKTVGRFTETIVSNVSELAELLPGFNFTGDPAMTQVAETLKRDLSAFTAKELRENKLARTETAAKAAKVRDKASEMASYFGGTNGTHGVTEE